MNWRWAGRGGAKTYIYSMNILMLYGRAGAVNRSK